MPHAVPGLDSPRPLAELLEPGKPWPLRRALRVAHGVALQARALHENAQTHRAITPEEIVVDEKLRPSLSAPAPARRFGGDGYDPETCPPELAEGDAVELPPGIEAAMTLLRQAGRQLDPRPIDVYQLGAVLCRLLTGDSVRTYMLSPAAKARVPELARPILDRALGHDGGEPLADCGLLIDALADAFQRAGAKPGHATGQETPARGSQIGLGGDTPAHGSPPAPPPRTGRPSEAPLPFARLGGYEIVARIGRGGMGDVYQGYEPALDRHVAIKVLPAELARDEEFVRRFRAEATAAAKVAHPNVVPIHSIGEDAGHHYFAMQFIDGEPLSARLQRQHRLPVEEALAVVEQCLAGLEAAHARGLIHRDIKPGNILLERATGRAVLVDFGLVRRMGHSTQMTATGVIMGTVDYIAPEQARGQAVDGRADLYSLGVFLYQVLAGRLPFEADTPTAMIFQHAYEAPLALEKAAPDVPAPLAAIVDKLLRKDPNERYSSARAVIDELAAFREGRPVAAERPDACREGPLPTAAYSAAGEEKQVFAGVAGEGRRGRLRDWAATLFRRHAPQFVKELQNTTQQIEGAVAQHERRRKRVAGLLEEARSIASDLARQIEANRQAAAEAQRQAQSGAADESKEALARRHEKCQENVAALQSQLDAQQAQIDALELDLNKADATLAQLRSQRDLLAARLRAAEAQRALESNLPRRSPPRWVPAAAVCGAMILGALAVLLLARLVPRGTVAPVPADSAPPLAIAPFDAASEGTGNADQGASPEPSAVSAPEEKIELPPEHVLLPPMPVAFRGPINKVIAGGLGRYLCVRHFGPKGWQLSVVDVGTAKTICEVPFADQYICMAASRDKLFTWRQSDMYLTRWDLVSGSMEVTVPYHGSEKPLGVAIGAAATGPLVVTFHGQAGREMRLFDADTLKQLPCPPRTVPATPYDIQWLSASDDGITFVLLLMPQGRMGRSCVLRCLGDRLVAQQTDKCEFYASPTSDGRLLCSANGVRWLEVSSRPPSSLSPHGRPLPACGGGLYFDVLANVPNVATLDSKMVLYGPLGGKPLLTLAGLPKQPRNIRVEGRYLWLPLERKVAVIDDEANAVVIYDFDLLAALKTHNIDGAFVASFPPREAVMGAAWQYPLRVEMTRPGATFTLVAGPGGMAIRPDGMLTWQVPPDFPQNVVQVSVAVKTPWGAILKQEFLLRVLRGGSVSQDAHIGF